MPGQSAAPLGGARDRPLRPSPGRAWRSGRLDSRRGIGGKTSWAAGFEYHHHHQQQQRHKRQLNATSPSIHTTQDAALARDLSTQSGALTGRFAGGSSAGVQGYAYQNAQGQIGAV